VDVCGCLCSQDEVNETGNLLSTLYLIAVSFPGVDQITGNIDSSRRWERRPRLTILLASKLLASKLKRRGTAGRNTAIYCWIRWWEASIARPGQLKPRLAQRLWCVICLRAAKGL